MIHHKRFPRINTRQFNIYMIQVGLIIINLMYKILIYPLKGLEFEYCSTVRTNLYCIVLMGWSLRPNALRPFQIYYTPPNLNITTT